MTIEFGKIITDYLKNEGYEGNSMDVGWIFSTAPASLQLFLVYLADYLQEHMEHGELIKCEADFSSDTQRTIKKDSSKDNSYAELQQELEHEEKALLKQLKVLDADEARIDADIQLKCTELRSSFISSSDIEWGHSEYLKQKRSEIEKCLSKFETWLDCLDYQWNNLQNTNGSFKSDRDIQLQIDELVRIYTNLETKSAETKIETAILRGQIEAMNNTVHPGELYDRISLETKRKELNQLKDTVLKDSLVLSDICKYEILLPILKTQAEHRKECLVALQDHLNVLQDNAKDVLKQLTSYSALTSEQRDIITTLVSTKSSCKSQIKDIVTNSKDRIAVLNHFYKGKTEVEKQLIHEQDSFLNNLNELINGGQEANNLYTSLAELRSKAEEFVSKLDISARDKEAEVEHLARTAEQELLQLFTSSFDRSFHPSRSLKNANLLKAQVETISVAGKMQQKINDAMSILTLFVESEHVKGERRFDKATTIAQLKQKLEQATGIPANTMLIKLFDNNRLLAVLDDESKMLGFYPVDNLHVLKVIDNDPYRPKNEYLDVSNVEKYEISEKDYEKRQDTVRNFLKQNKLGKFSEKEAVTSERLYAEYQGKIKVGDRCLVTLDTFPKRGTVQYFGETEFKPGFWVGVEYDEPVGKHNGTVQGKQYFTCSDKYGAFVRPDKCEIGDFPPLDIEDEIEEM